MPLATAKHTSKGTTTKARKPVKVLAIVLGVIVGIVAICAIAVFVLLNVGHSQLVQPADSLRFNSSAVSDDGGKTVTYKGSKYAYNDNLVSVLVMGCDRRPDGSGQSALATKYGSFTADAIVDVVLNTNTGEVTCIVVPRNSMVSLSALGEDEEADFAENMGGHFQICMAFSGGENDDAGAKRMCKAVSRILYDIPIPNYYLLYWDSIGELSEVVGGVEVEFLERVFDIPGEPGEVRTLSGYSAMQYVQYRNTDVKESTANRQKRQEQFIKAFAAKTLEVAKTNPMVLMDLYEVLQKYSTTNLDFLEFSYIASVLLTHGISSVDLMSLPGTMHYDEEFQSTEYILDYQSIYETVLDTYYTKIS